VLSGDRPVSKEGRDGLQSDYGLAARRHLQGGSAARVYAQS